MDKRYQVFISSTFTDLLEERQSVLRAVLELDHMPAGMELFPASDETAWQLIKDVIDASDYYILVIGGRYGSTDEAGLGYTEKEYDYAVSTKKPIIPLLHKNPSALPREKTETNELAWKKLEAFRKKVEQRHTCVYWDSAEGLKAKVIVGITSSLKRHPAVGWIRADQVPSEATISELLLLKERISELEASAESERTQPPKGTEDLFQGNDQFEIKLSFDARVHLSGYPSYEDTPFNATISPTWNDIFAFIAPSMISETSERDLFNSFRTFFESFAVKLFQNSKGIKGKEMIHFKINNEDLDTCIVQLRALGLIKESIKQRSVKNIGTYWTLTPYGDHLMVQLRALRRKINFSKDSTGKVTQANSSSVKVKEE